MLVALGTFVVGDPDERELEEGAGEVYRRLNCTRPSSSERGALLQELRSFLQERLALRKTLQEQLALRRTLLERREHRILQQGQQGLHSLQQGQQQHNPRLGPPGHHKRCQEVRLG